MEYRKTAAGIRSIFLALFCLAFFATQACGSYLNKFLDEDTAAATSLTLTYVSDTSAAVLLTQNRLSIRITFSANQDGTYKLVHGSSCATGTPSAIAAQAGAGVANQNITATAFVEELAQAANTILICYENTARTKSASLTKTFATSIFTDLAYLQNETYGASGAPIDSGNTTAFQIFQNVQTSPNWSNAVINRTGVVATIQNGTNEPYGLGAYIDVNDSYKLKLLIADRNNHRILIFNSIPTSNASNPDVVVGQPNFTSGTSNFSTGTTGNNGLNRPYAARVCANGKLVVADRSNHRVAVFNSVPKSNAAVIDFVLGQNDFAGNTANNPVVTMNARINLPNDAMCLRGKLYIIDSGNHRIVVHNSLPSASAASADYPIGQANLTAPGASGFDFSSASNFLNTPFQIAYVNSQFYVVDASNHRVLVFNSLPIAGQKPDFIVGQTAATNVITNQGSPNPLQSSLSNPRSITFKGTKLAITDQNNERIMFFNTPITANAPNATHQQGRNSFTDAVSGTVKQGTFSGQLPKDILIDGNFLWVADAGNHRIQYIPLPF